MPSKPEILSIRTVAASRLFAVEELDLRFSNGSRARFERLRPGGRGAVLIVPMPDADTVLLIREYAAGVDRYELGLPKGLMEQGEDVETAANREIMEEIGFGAERLERLTCLSIAPGYLGHRTHVVLARNLYPKRLPGDEPEEIEVVPWRLSCLEALLERDDFSEARSIAALFLARERLSHEL
jgi:ADP-ribose diphosphatase